ncbi:MAG: hypothetical protein IPJ34_12605 [Myxococcales bacterium]|nr:hypothetical protein [Myxococcales bacterium]
MFDVSEEELELEHYDITQEGDDKPSYEMWVYLGEHGIVFEVGSEEPTSVHCVEGHFWSVGDDDLVGVMLAKALDHASPF